MGENDNLQQLAFLALSWAAGFVVAAAVDSARHRMMPADYICDCRRCYLLAEWRERKQHLRAARRLAAAQPAS